MACGFWVYFGLVRGKIPPRAHLIKNGASLFPRCRFLRVFPPQEVVPIPQTESFAEYLAIPEVVNG
jgi:hypothetical protein